jgi:hypothetical protein
MWKIGVTRPFNGIVRHSVMRPRIQPAEAMSQVVFVHDYIQLVFQDDGFSIYNRATLHIGANLFIQGQPGFCDQLVALIGQRAVVTAGPDHSLELAFDGGVRFAVPMGDSATGPEAWQFHSLEGPIVVVQNV